MLVNETPVVVRHVYQPAMQFCHYVENRFGSDWHKWHLWIGYQWNGFLLAAIAFADWEKKGLKLVFAVLGSCFTVYLCADRIEEEKKRSLTNGALGLFNRFNFVHDSLLSLIGNNLGND